MKRHEKKEELKKETLDYQDVYSWVELSPFKRMMNNHSKAFELTNQNYGYMQILEITGKDINSLGKAEIQHTLLNYYDWLTQFTSDHTYYVTTLPTNTTDQVSYLKQYLSHVRNELKECHYQQLYAQLQDREFILSGNIQAEELIHQEIYNIEFIPFIFGKNVKEFEDNVRKVKSYRRGNFFPKDISAEKKILILK